jgi:sulfatase modifying factor 1
MKSYWLVSALVLCLALAECHAVMIDWVTVGDPGNQTDVTGFGGVPYTYQIGKYGITNTEYADFLNAVAADDPNGLYNAGMNVTAEGGIQQYGEPGNYGYALRPGRQRKPVSNVSFWDAVRFANWLHNGQPVGPQGPGTTEVGAYTLTAEGVADNTVTRNPGATVFIPSEDEWYKAAYYKGGGQDAGYWLYPTRSDEPPVAEPPPGGPNSANFDLAVRRHTDVDAYAAAFSSYGTFDQGGNLWEWNETISDQPIPGLRGIRGGSVLEHESTKLSSTYRSMQVAHGETSILGFRVARIPEPATFTGLLAGILAIGVWRRRKGFGIKKCVLEA